MPEHEVLQDDPHRQVLRVGDTVRRPMHPGSTTVHELLRHLANVGFPYSPRVLGVDEDGREVLSYIAGDSCPAGWASVVEGGRVFDVLQVDGAPVMDQPYEHRRQLLTTLGLAGDAVRVPPHFVDVDTVNVVAAACAYGLEGVMAKLLGSR
jgi:hypothetical protein